MEKEMRKKPLDMELILSLNAKYWRAKTAKSRLKIRETIDNLIAKYNQGEK